MLPKLVPANYALAGSGGSNGQIGGAKGQSVPHVLIKSSEFVSPGDNFCFIAF